MHNTTPLLNHQVSSPDMGEDVIDAFKEFINAKVPHKQTKAHMEVTMRDIERYMLYIKKELRLKEWTSADLAGFKHFLEIEHTFFDKNGKCRRKYQYIYNASPLPWAPKARGGNTIFAIMKRFRTMLNWCVKTGKLDKSPFSTYQLQSCVYGTPFYMTLD